MVGVLVVMSSHGTVSQKSRLRGPVTGGIVGVSSVGSVTWSGAGGVVSSSCRRMEFLSSLASVFQLLMFWGPAPQSPAHVRWYTGAREACPARLAL